MASFSKILKRERIKKGLSKADMARKLNIPYTTYQNYENGREPKIEVIKSIAEKLDIDPNIFFQSDDTDITSNRSYRSRRYNRTQRTNNPVSLNDYNLTTQLNTYNSLSHHQELEYILLYDSKKFSEMKESADKNYENLETRYFKLHTLLKDFENELKSFRRDFFVRIGQEKLFDDLNSLNEIIERSYDEAEHFCQEIDHKSQYMNESTINQFKKNNPNYREEILKEFFQCNPNFQLDTEDETILDSIYKLIISTYLI